MKDGLVRNAEVVGEYLLGRLRELKDKHPIIGDVRGKGLMIGVELVRDRVTKERATTERDRLVQEMFKRGVLILGAGRNAIRFAPPLVLTGPGRHRCVDLRQSPRRGDRTDVSRQIAKKTPVVLLSPGSGRGFGVLDQQVAGTTGFSRCRQTKFTMESSCVKQSFC